MPMSRIMMASSSVLPRAAVPRPTPIQSIATQISRPHQCAWRVSVTMRPSLMQQASLQPSPEASVQGLPLSSPAPGADDAEALARAGWDPEGIFSSAKPLSKDSGVDLFARQAARRKQVAASAKPSPSTAAPDAHIPVAAALTPATPITTTSRGIPAAVDSPGRAYSRAEMNDLLESRFVGVDLSWPGLSILNMDPPVLHVDQFLNAKECQEWMSAAEATGSMQVSKIGAGNANAAPVGGVNAYDQRRTSLSVLLDPSIQSRHPALQRLVQAFQSKAQKLLRTGGKSWGRPGRMPSAGQYTFESPQVARYELGQHFLSHEDAFPVRLARHNGFQRHATLLLYLNDVSKGGATEFDHLGLAVHPTQGSLLIFFPAFSDCRPDPRSLHTAQDAQDTKWVMQQWVVRGFTEPPPLMPPAQSTSQVSSQGNGTPPTATAQSSGLPQTKSAAANQTPAPVQSIAQGSSTVEPGVARLPRTTQQEFTVLIKGGDEESATRKAKKAGKAKPPAKKGFGKA